METCPQCLGAGVIFPLIPPEMADQVSQRCPTCEGWGFVRSANSMRLEPELTK